MEVGTTDHVPRREPVQEAADFARRFGGARPAAIAAHALVLSKPDHDGATGLERCGIAVPGLNNLTQTRIVLAARLVIWPHSRLKPRKPLGRA
jgi:hypothetical protein